MRETEEREREKKREREGRDRWDGVQIGVSVSFVSDDPF